jgi:hypothetical protein
MCASTFSTAFMSIKKAQSRHPARTRRRPS